VAIRDENRAKTIFFIVALTLVAQPVAAHRHTLADAWQFQPQPFRGPLVK